MRWHTRNSSILILAFISVFLILLLPLSIQPAFAEDNPPPDPTPTAEPPPPVETQAEATPPEAAPGLDESQAPPDSLVPDSEIPNLPSGRDPYFTIFGVTYRFSSGATYCVDNFPGDPNCTQGLTSPFQAAITDLNGRGTPDDGTVYVEDGVYAENVVIDGGDWASTPTSLTVRSLSGSGTTTVQGFTIRDMLDFILQGFTVTDGVAISGNTGTLSLSDIVATNTSGDGINVSGQDGDVLFDSVQANANAGVGASIDNTAGNGDVTITDSQFNDNNTTPAGGQQGGLEVNSDGTVTLNNVQASGNLDGDGASITANTIVVNGGSFNQNTSPLAGFGNGLAAQSTGGSIKVGGMKASNNEESGALLWYPAPDADPANLITVENSSLKSNGQFGVWAQPESGIVELRCVCLSGNGFGETMVPVGETLKRYPCPEKEDEQQGPKYKYVGVLLSTEEPKIVNATNGVLVTFPPIQIIDPDQLAIGKVWPRKKFELPAEIPQGDTFMAGVEVQMINAEFVEGLEDGLLKIEFFIPGYLVEREFSVLWWDVVAEEWVEVPFEFVPHVRLPGGKIVAEWPETGTFILVLHPEAAL